MTILNGVSLSSRALRTDGLGSEAASSGQKNPAMVLSSFKLTLCTCREREGTCGDEVSNWVDTKERERRLVEEAAGLGRPGRNAHCCPVRRLPDRGLAYAAFLHLTANRCRLRLYDHSAYASAVRPHLAAISGPRSVDDICKPHASSAKLTQSATHPPPLTFDPTRPTVRQRLCSGRRYCIMAPKFIPLQPKDSRGSRTTLRCLSTASTPCTQPNHLGISSRRMSSSQPS
jgi:hypothetical protein